MERQIDGGDACSVCGSPVATYDGDVAAFHRRFGLPTAGAARPAALMDQATYRYRLKFLYEELVEFSRAHEGGDLEKALDGLVDLAWVAIGTAHYMGCPFDAAWSEVRRANMDKVSVPAGGDPTKPYRDAGPQVAKPPGWLPPDVAGAIRLHELQHGRTWPAPAEGAAP